MFNLRNLYLPDGTWVGQFIDADAAADWAKKNGFNPSDCEISDRKVVREGYRIMPAPVSTEEEFISEAE